MSQERKRQGLFNNSLSGVACYMDFNSYLTYYLDSVPRRKVASRTLKTKIGEKGRGFSFNILHNHSPILRTLTLRF